MAKHPNQIWIDWTGARKINVDQPDDAISTYPVEGDARYVEVPHHIPNAEAVVVVQMSSIYAYDGYKELRQQSWFKWAYFQMATEKRFAIEFDPTGANVPAHLINETIEWILNKFNSFKNIEE